MTGIIETTTVVCVNVVCGLPFQIPIYVYEQARSRPDRNVWCPSCGTRFHYAEPESERLKRELQQREQRITELCVERNEANARARRAERTASYWKGIAHRRAA